MSSWRQHLGAILFALFYLVSLIMVIRHGAFSRTAELTGVSDEHTITFAHWQLEDGFREGFDEAIRIFEELKAKEGVKVKVVQTAIPRRTYPQWFMTQLIGGNCADVIELSAGGDLLNQYFIPLSEHLGDPNPYNRGTSLEGVPWRDTYVDELTNAFDRTFSEYFGIGLYTTTIRMYVNTELFRNACGDRPYPVTVNEWIDCCRQILAYGEKIGVPLIPIGVNGFTKETITQLVNYYNNQLNADFNDFINPHHGFATVHTVVKGIADRRLPTWRLLAPYEVVADVGRYFADGFPAIDAEQTKFLFATGRVAFFIDNNIVAYSMVRNTNFPVDIIPIPEIGRTGHRYSEHFLGRMTETGWTTGMFGIPKSSREPELALDFLRFITSYRINKLTIVDHTKWLSPLRDMQYEDPILRKCQPFEGARYFGFAQFRDISTLVRSRVTQAIEQAILSDSEDPAGEVWQSFIDSIDRAQEDLRESIVYCRRSNLSIEARRSSFAIGALKDPGYHRLRRINMETTSQRLNQERIIEGARVDLGRIAEEFGTEIPEGEEFVDYGR